MDTAVSYARISTKSKDGKQSVESQEPVIVDYCTRNRLKLVRQYNEEISGTKKYEQRPVLNELFEFIFEHNHKNLVVVELSRLGRNIADIINIGEILQEHKVCIHFIKEGFKTLDEDGEPNGYGEMMLFFGGWFAKMEAKKFKERSSRGLHYAAKELGRWSGGALLPYGYKRSQEVETKKQLVLDDDEAEKVREIFDMYLNQDMGTTKIAHNLNMREVKTRYNKNLKNKVKIKNSEKYREPDRFIWRDGTIWNILSNPIYKGVRIYKGEEMKAPIIIEPEIFDKVQFLLNDKYSKKNNPTHHFYFLQAVRLICGRCGQSYYALKRSNNNDNRYVCLSKRNKDNECDNTGIGIDKLTSGVWYVIKRTEEMRDFILKAIDGSSTSKKVKALKSEIITLKKRIHLQDIEQKTLYELKKYNRIPDDAYNTEYDETNRIIKECLTKITHLEEELNRKMLEMEVKKNINQVIKEVKEDDDEMKRYITSLVRTLTIYPVKNNVRLTEISNDKMVLVKMELHQTDKSLFFALSFYSKKVLVLNPDEVDLEKCEIKDVVSRAIPIPYPIKPRSPEEKVRLAKLKEEDEAELKIKENE